MELLTIIWQQLKVILSGGEQTEVGRLVNTITILLDKKRIGMQELADTSEVSPRIIYRDIDAINMVGIPVRAIPGVDDGFEIVPDYKIDGQVLSTVDLSALLMGFTSLLDMMRGDELIHALTRVKSFIPAD